MESATTRLRGAVVVSPIVINIDLNFLAGLVITLDASWRQILLRRVVDGVAAMLVERVGVSVPIPQFVFAGGLSVSTEACLVSLDVSGDMVGGKLHILQAPRRRLGVLQINAEIVSERSEIEAHLQQARPSLRRETEHGQVDLGDAALLAGEQVNGLEDGGELRAVRHGPPVDAAPAAPFNAPSIF